MTHRSAMTASTALPRNRDLAAFWKANGQPVDHRRVVKIHATATKLIPSPR